MTNKNSIKVDGSINDLRKNLKKIEDLTDEIYLACGWIRHSIMYDLIGNLEKAGILSCDKQDEDI